MRIVRLMLLAALTALVGSCASAPVNIPPDLTPAEMIQRGQEATEQNKYDQAAQYYKAILDRYPDDNSMVCASEYELAFIHYKKKRYDEAELGFRALLSRYDEADAELLPPQYKILSEKVLAKIELEKK